jgi:hypothetical protein
MSMDNTKFTVVPTGVLFSAISPTCKLLYAVMSSYGQAGRGVVWPHQSSLAEAVGVSERQLRRLLLDLQSAGFISRIRTMKTNGQFGRNEYELLGFTVSSSLIVSPEDTDVLRSPPEDMGVPHHRTLVSGTIGHGCPVENNTNEQYQKNNTRRFAPPAKEEVKEFFLTEKNCTERSAERGADAFVNFYESKGWVVGKTKMTRWKAAAAGWFTRGLERGEFTIRTKVKADDDGVY